MIKIKSHGYWSVGITVTWSPRAHRSNNVTRSGWQASLDFLDDGFCDDNTDAGLVSTQGHLQTRYFVADGENESGLGVALDVLLTDALRLGITFQDPMINYRGDGEDEDYPPPVGWKQDIAEQAHRLGWRTPYKTRQKGITS